MPALIPNRLDLDDDAAIVALVAANPEWRLEFSSDGHILVSPLTGTATGSKELEPGVQLALFARSAGGKAFGAAAGFRLADTSLLGPDASWISSERLAALSPVDTEPAFWHVCPDVVVEVMSEWDTWKALTEKIDRFERNGACYAVAVDPELRRIYERGTPPAGLEFDFEAIFDA
jgi:Uma2 family endonuclease